jgi:hypothetical protein
VVYEKLPGLEDVLALRGAGLLDDLYDPSPEAVAVVEIVVEVAGSADMVDRQIGKAVGWLMVGIDKKEPDGFECQVKEKEALFVSCWIHLLVLSEF